MLLCTDSKQKWKKIDIELPKQERRRRGGSRQRLSEVRDAPRGGRDRPAPTRKYRSDQPEKTPVKDDVKVEATAAASSGSPTSQTSRRKEKGSGFEIFFVIECTVCCFMEHVRYRDRIQLPLKRLPDSVSLP